MEIFLYQLISFLEKWRIRKKKDTYISVEVVKSKLTQIEYLPLTKIVLNISMFTYVRLVYCIGAIGDLPPIKI